MKTKQLWIKFKRYFHRCLIALDQLINTVLVGWPDETFSARVWRKAKGGDLFWCFLRWLIDLLFFWEPDHCRQSYESERFRRHFPQELRDEI